VRKVTNIVERPVQFMQKLGIFHKVSHLCDSDWSKR